jgi:hypothetical protein
VCVCGIKIEDEIQRFISPNATTFHGISRYILYIRPRMTSRTDRLLLPLKGVALHLKLQKQSRIFLFSVLWTDCVGEDLKSGPSMFCLLRWKCSAVALCAVLTYVAFCNVQWTHRLSWDNQFCGRHHEVFIQQLNIRHVSYKGFRNWCKMENTWSRFLVSLLLSPPIAFHLLIFVWPCIIDINNKEDTQLDTIITVYW